MSLSVRKVSLPTWIVILGLVVLFVSCKKADAPSYKVFANPEDAGNALRAGRQSLGIKTKCWQCSGLSRRRSSTQAMPFKTRLRLTRSSKGMA